MKKALALVLSVLTLISVLVCSTAFAADGSNGYISTRLLSEVAMQAVSNIGNKEYNGYCEKFIETMFRNAGFSVPRMYDAKAAANAWIISTSRTGIPIGAIVFINATNAHPNGHAGIYIGDGYVVDALAKVTKRTLSDFMNNTYAGGSTYAGWGIPNRHMPDYNPDNRRVGGNASIGAEVLNVYNASSGGSVIHTLKRNEIVLFTGARQDSRVEVTFFKVSGWNYSVVTGWVDPMGLLTNLGES